MGLTLIVFNLTLILSVSFAWLGQIIREKVIGNFFLFVCLCFILFISGFRGLEVGTDNSTYAQYYNDLDPTVGLWENILFNIGVFEPGFIALNHFLRSVGASYVVASFVYSFITWQLIFKSFKSFKEIRHLVIFLLITTGFLFFTFNGIRQAIAASVVFCSTPLVLKRKYFKFFICLIPASFFHLSVLLMSSIILVVKLKKLTSRFWGILFAISALIPGKLLYGLIGVVAFLFPFYGSYTGREDFNANASLSLGVLYQIILGFVLLYYYKPVANTKSKLLYFHLSFIGQVLYNLFYSNPFINRFLVYFLFFEVYAFGFTIHFLLQKKRTGEVLLIMLSFFLVFIYRIIVGESGIAPYKFSF